MSVQSPTKATTVNSLSQLKQAGEKFACITVYDYCSAVAASEAGIELLLVGDSLGMVIQGHDTTVPVTVASGYESCTQLCNIGKAALIPKAIKKNQVARLPNSIVSNLMLPVSEAYKAMPPSKTTPDVT